MNGVVGLFLLAVVVAVPAMVAALGRSRMLPAAGVLPAAVALVAALAAGVLVGAFLLEPGPIAGALTVPWLTVATLGGAAAVLRFLRDPGRLRPRPAMAIDFALGFLLLGAGFLLVERLGVRLFDFPASLVLLAAVHYTVAGFVLVVAGTLAWRARPARWLAVAIASLIVGIPVTAIGFFDLPLANWIGALLVATGGCGIGLGHLAVARRAAGWRAIGLAIAGVSLLVSMPLAAIFATSLFLGTAGPDVALMARIHGGLNVLGFAVPAALAWAVSSVPVPGRPDGVVSRGRHLVRRRPVEGIR